MRCKIEERSDGKILFEALDLGESLELQADNRLKLNGCMDLHNGVYNKITENFDLPAMSFRLCTYSDVPIGSGLRGSSTLVVAIVAAFTEWLNLPLGEYDTARLAYEIERVDIGIVGGAQDHYAATFGGFNFMEFYEKGKVVVNPLRIKSWVIAELQESIVLYFTDSTRKASQIEVEKKSLLQSEEAISAMHEVKNDALRMKEHLLMGNFEKFAVVLGKSWESKKRVSDSISNSEIDRLYDLAISNGAYSGKLSGAGGGEFMFFMVNPTEKFHLVAELNKEQGRVVDFHFVKEGTIGWRS